MIQDIGSNTIDTEFARPKPKDGDYVLLFAHTDVFVLPETGKLTTYADWKRLGGEDAALVHIFEQAGTQFFTVLQPQEEITGRLRKESSRYLRKLQPEWLRLGSVTALHLFQWFRGHQFCGHCGAPTQVDTKELAVRCSREGCRAVTYPTISPAIIVGIVHDGKLLLTRSSVYKNPVYALVSGYMSVGETFEMTVKREVREETGLDIKNIRYYGNQPWGFSGAQMIGFWAELDGSAQVHLQQEELKEAGWFAPEEIPPTYEKDPLDLTHYMIELFRARKAPVQQ